MSASFDFKIDPFENFLHLFDEAKKQIPKDPNAMSLATVGQDGAPSVRIVLFKGLVRGGFSFYTNYESQKSKEMLLNNRVGLLFYWPAIDVQVRIQGITEKLKRAESEEYFQSRPRISQLGAWASAQSQTISGPEELQKKMTAMETKYLNQPVPCPPNWGGFHVLPVGIEFWFGREGRLHDRYVYERTDIQAPWTTRMKSP
ncbi:MAG: pyridoxamine 5'-phosphate oxidase [Bdellovibrio sp. CG10_big_fil_rev_8_21_14_0_10_47_8]|nr:MAG: pyridoxamine 5'-phosphate oxidase [Bdellovibrio sp. CG10_big_fil_rev_8_21_14_0_10_47_8]